MTSVTGWLLLSVAIRRSCHLTRVADSRRSLGSVVMMSRGDDSTSVAIIGPSIKAIESIRTWTFIQVRHARRWGKRGTLPLPGTGRLRERATE